MAKNGKYLNMSNFYRNSPTIPTTSLTDGNHHQLDRYQTETAKGRRNSDPWLHRALQTRIWGMGNVQHCQQFA